MRSKFVVVSQQGPSWVAGRAMRDQLDWAAHAAWVNDLASRGVIVLAGPLRGRSVHRAMLIVHSESEEALRAQLITDPWMRSGVLRIESIEPWEVLAWYDALGPVLDTLEVTSPTAR